MTRHAGESGWDYVWFFTIVILLMLSCFGAFQLLFLIGDLAHVR